ncbi:MAG TPA: SOS response-associated peptidase [Candidatus Saccharimonadales bacterium]|nr:SOS response-associated peptidase [Candidatus Saccharimonadales bacterium]
MCGRYGFSIKDEREVLERFDIEKINFELRNSYNVAPTQEMPIVERHSPNSLNLRKWGIFPSFMNGGMLINAQAEKLAISGVWKKAFIENRCIVPATFFYEWKKLSDGKQPYLIKPKYQKLFGFAGIIVKYHDKEKKEKEGYIIITTTPNSLMKEIHNRMPVILRKEDEDEWLNPDNVEPEKLLKLLTPYPASEMEAYPISTLVNTPKNNFPEIIKPLNL